MRHGVARRWAAWEGLLARIVMLPCAPGLRIAVRLGPPDDPPNPGMELTVPGLGVVPAAFNREYHRQRLILEHRRPGAE